MKHTLIIPSHRTQYLHYSVHVYNNATLSELHSVEGRAAAAADA